MGQTEGHTFWLIWKTEDWRKKITLYHRNTSLICVSLNTCSAEKWAIICRPVICFSPSLIALLFGSREGVMNGNQTNCLLCSKPLQARTKNVQREQKYWTYFYSSTNRVCCELTDPQWVNSDKDTSADHLHPVSAESLPPALVTAITRLRQVLQKIWIMLLSVSYHRSLLQICQMDPHSFKPFDPLFKKKIFSLRNLNLDVTLLP